MVGGLLTQNSSSYHYKYLLSFLALFLFDVFLAFGYIRLKIYSAGHLQGCDRLPNGTNANNNKEENDEEKTLYTNKTS